MDIWKKKPSKVGYFRKIEEVYPNTALVAQLNSPQNKTHVLKCDLNIEQLYIKLGQNGASCLTLYPPLYSLLSFIRNTDIYFLNYFLERKECHAKYFFEIGRFKIILSNIIIFKLESVAGPVIQANGRLTFEDDLRSGGEVYFTTQWTSVRTELADSMVTLGEPSNG